MSNVPKSDLISKIFIQQRISTPNRYPADGRVGVTYCSSLASPPMSYRGPIYFVRGCIGPRHLLQDRIESIPCPIIVDSEPQNNSDLVLRTPSHHAPEPLTELVYPHLVSDVCHPETALMSLFLIFSFWETLLICLRIRVSAFLLTVLDCTALTDRTRLAPSLFCKTYPSVYHRGSYCSTYICST